MRSGNRQTGGCFNGLDDLFTVDVSASPSRTELFSHQTLPWSVWNILSLVVVLGGFVKNQQPVSHYWYSTSFLLQKPLGFFGAQNFWSNFWGSLFFWWVETTEIRSLEAVELLARQLLQGPFPNVMSYTSTMSACEKAGTDGFIDLCVSRMADFFRNLKIVKWIGCFIVLPKNWAMFYIKDIPEL